MDTRSKILTADAALALSERPLAIAAGLFDVLRVAHVRELQKTRTSCAAAALLVVVLPCASGWLSQSARAELVAALRVVDYVMAGGAEELAALVQVLAPACVMDLHDLDVSLRQELKERVGQ